MPYELKQKDLVSEFIVAALNKVEEIKFSLNLIFYNMATLPEFELLYRNSFALKSLCSSFKQDHILNYLIKEFDPELNKLRNKTIEIETIKNNIIIKITFLHKMIISLNNDETNEINETNNVNIINETENLINYIDILAAVGQTSIWSFHDITNNLSKIQGYAEICLEMLNNISTLKTDEIKSYQKKILENTFDISDTIQRIRSLRTNTIIQKEKIPIKHTIENLCKNTLFTKYSISWHNSMLPDVIVGIDKFMFEIIWTVLWRLLAEWLKPNTIAKAMCQSNIEVKTKNNIDYPDQLFLYFWLEDKKYHKKDIINPFKLSFLTETIKYDLGGVFSLISKLAKQNDIEISYAETENTIPIFRVVLACGLNTGELLTFNSLKIEKATKVDNILATQTGAILENNSLPYVLVVDDNDDLGSLLKIKISKIGYNVIVCKSIAKARQILNEKNIDIVLADLFLSQESGLDLLREVKAINSKMAFIFMSDANEDDIPLAIFKVLSKFANAFLRKPISTVLLKETLDACIK